MSSGGHIRPLAEDVWLQAVSEILMDRPAYAGIGFGVVHQLVVSSV